MLDESLIVLLIIAHQILIVIEVEATPGRGLPQLKKNMWRGLLQLKRICGGDSHKFL